MQLSTHLSWAQKHKHVSVRFPHVVEHTYPFVLTRFVCLALPPRHSSQSHSHSLYIVQRLTDLGITVFNNKYSVVQNVVAAMPAFRGSAWPACASRSTSCATISANYFRRGPTKKKTESALTYSFAYGNHVFSVLQQKIFAI